jgi:hypothetical protein
MIEDLESEFDSVSLRMLLGLRVMHRLEPSDVAQLRKLVDRVAEALGDQRLIPRSFVGKLWYVFTASLAEADHSSSPEPVLDFAWDYAQSLHAIFGPTFE